MMTTIESAPSDQMVRTYRPGHYRTLSEEVRDLLAHSFLIRLLVHRDLTVRYKRSVLGFLWTMLHPLLLMVIFVLIFSAVFRFAVEHYETYFLSEYLGWMFFAQTTMGAMTSVAWNGALMKRVRVPGSIFVIASVLSGIANLGLAFIPFLGVMIVVGAPLHLTMLFVPVSILVLALFTAGVSLALFPLSIYFADTREMYQVVINALFYLTPIMYPLSVVPEKFRFLISWNPLHHLLELFRKPLYDGVLPTGSEMTICLLLAFGAMAVGWVVFRRMAPGFFAHI